MTRFDFSATPEHGGQLQAAVRRWNIPRAHWLDLSTGINPVPWPVPDIPPEVWHRLPEQDDGLEEIIRAWAGAPDSACCLPVAGSQAAIMALPAVRARLHGRGRVAVPVPGYREHGHAWSRAGFEVIGIPQDVLEQEDLSWLDSVDVVVWIQPNNPTGQILAPALLRAWHQRLQARAGWLIVDEAFLPIGDDRSLAVISGLNGLVVLKSAGKFFGLAGLRAGSVLVSEGMASALLSELGPWSVSGPARCLLAQMLQDRSWQKTALNRLRRQSERMRCLLVERGVGETRGTVLFRYMEHTRAHVIGDHLARQGILIRTFDYPLAIRVGLPGAEDEWQRLERALQTL